MRFTKMQGCGNDYIYVNCFEEEVREPAQLAIRLSDRNYGIGSDGLILIEPSERADAYMHMFNRDGSEGMMCGNGLRCVAKYIYDHGLIPRDRTAAVIDTKSGLKEVALTIENGLVTEVTVDMGIAEMTGKRPSRISVSGIDLVYYGMDIGNPHAVYFVEENPALEAWQAARPGCVPTEAHPGPVSLQDIDIRRIQEAAAREDIFPEGVNSEFVSVISRNEIDFRVWERGSGETMACGTGAAAAVAAGCILGKFNEKVIVHLKGGDLSISYDEKTGRCLMSGPAVEVFSGTI